MLKSSLLTSSLSDHGSTTDFLIGMTEVGAFCVRGGSKTPRGQSAKPRGKVDQENLGSLLHHRTENGV